MISFTSKLFIASALLTGSTYAYTQQALVPKNVQIERLKQNRNQFPLLDNRPSLVKQVEESNQDIYYPNPTYAQSGVCRECDAASPDNKPEFKWAIKNSDLVMIGTVLTRTSSLTAHEGFVFTDSEVRPLELIKGQVNPDVQNDGGDLKEVTVSVPGGKVRINNHVVRVDDPISKELMIGHSYILFLKYIPESHSYTYAAELAPYDISTNPIEHLSKVDSGTNKDFYSDRALWMKHFRSSIKAELEGVK